MKGKINRRRSWNSRNLIIRVSGWIRGAFDTFGKSRIKQTIGLCVLLTAIIAGFCFRKNFHVPRLTPIPGEVWTQAASSSVFTARYFQSGVVFNDAMWIIGGNNGHEFLNDVWSSTDGINWKLVTGDAVFNPRYSHASVVYDGKIWVIGGFDHAFKNDVWSSADGAHWAQVTPEAAFSPRAAMSCVVFNNAIYLIGGYSKTAGGEKNDVWTSTDGAHWSPVVMAAPFQPRDIFSSVTLNGSIWVITGLHTVGSSASVYNDIWSSSNGIDWAEVTDKGEFSGRYGQTSVVFNEALWVIGGNIGLSPYLNDVWRSKDGAHWDPITTRASFPERYAHTSLVFKGKMWVLAGLYSNSTPLNDVWYSP